MQHVMCLVLVAFMAGARWVKPGDEIPLDLQRAKSLEKKRKVEILGQPIDGPPPAVKPVNATLRPKPPTETRPAPPAPPAANVPTPLEEIGIAGKAADLLRAGGLATVESLRAALDDQADPLAVLVAVQGIGEKTAASILAALDVAE